MKENSISDQLKTARQELAAAEQHEADLRAEHGPAFAEAVQAEMDLKELPPAKKRRLAALKGELEEIAKIVAAKRERVRKLHLLSLSKEVEAAKRRQREFVNEVVLESRKIDPLLRELLAIRKRMLEIEDAESIFTRSTNRALQLDGSERLQERLRLSLGNIIPPSVVDPDVWQDRAERSRMALADF